MTDWHGHLESEADSGWCLEGTDGQERGVRLLLEDLQLTRSALGVTVGRHPALCELLLSDPTVSRRHLRIGRSGDGLFAEDINSLNGTLLDGARLRPFEPVNLYDGARLTLGTVELSLRRTGRPIRH